jgi:hypothetical protein
MNTTSSQASRKILVVAIMVPIAALHFITGKHYSGPFPGFVNGYLIDIFLPFGVYFLLGLFQHRWLQTWWLRVCMVFTLGAAIETAQFFGIPVFGRTFDPLDYVMYAGGALLAAVCDRLVFPRLFSFWPGR